MMPESATIYPLTDTPNFKVVQERLLEMFNVDYQLETIMPAEYQTVVSTRFASGTDLPDIINFRYPQSRLIDLYKNGLILKLNDLVDAYAPDIKELFEIRPFLVIANGDREGNILRIPQNLVENPQHRMHVLFIRNDWLKALGYDFTDIQTPDNFYEALKAFQDYDSNENNKKDEVFTVAGVFGPWQISNVIGPAFGAINLNGNGASESWYYDDDGKIYHTFLTPEAKTYVEYMNKLYAEGLLDNDFANQTGEQFNEKLFNNQISARVGPWWDGTGNNMNLRNKGFEDAEIVPLGLPITDIGKPMIYTFNLAGNGGYMFTKDCKDPAVAMAVLNYGYTLDGTILSYYGVEDKEIGNEYWEPGNQFEDLKLAPYNVLIGTEFWRTENLAEPLLWDKLGINRGLIPHLMLGGVDDVVLGQVTNFGPTLGGLAGEKEFIQKYLNMAISYWIPAISFAAPTDEQASEWEGFSDLWLYMNETFVRFITGEEPIAKWDDYVAQANKLGLDKALDMRQDQYDAYVKIIGQ